MPSSSCASCVHLEPASRSYGLQVARLAGVPPAVIAAAKEKLQALERAKFRAGVTASPICSSRGNRLRRPRASGTGNNCAR